jgi:hypothetical protein
MKRKACIVITDRFLSLCEILANGATALEDIAIQLQVKFEMSKFALRKMLQAGKKHGYIVSSLYRNPQQNGIYALYALTPASAEILCRERDYRIESVRMQLPAPHHVVHDALARKVCYTIRREAKELGVELILADEYYLRIPLSGFPKKKPLPDFYVRFIMDSETSVPYDIEVDNSTVPARRLFDKARALPHKTLILCNKSRRKNLRESFTDINAYLENSKSKDKKTDAFGEKVFLGIIEDFCSPHGGIFGTIWENIYGRPSKFSLRDGLSPTNITRQT